MVIPAQSVDSRAPLMVQCFAKPHLTHVWLGFFLFLFLRASLSTKRRSAHFKEMHMLKLGVNKALCDLFLS